MGSYNVKVSFDQNTLIDTQVTLKEKENGEYRFSVRTGDEIDASSICKNFGGGGHRAAAGCTIFADFETAKEKMLIACRQALEENA